MTATEHVLLVDENDTPIGTAEKMAAHRDSLCHRAFSVFLFREQNGLEVLLQQRASHKYHSPNLWTNTCCSHPRPDEEILAAGERRLREEMGVNTKLTWAGRFHYIAHFENGLTENEIDHVLVGSISDNRVPFNPDEVRDCRWVNVIDLNNELKQQPDKFTPWLQQALVIAVNHWEM